MKVDNSWKLFEQTGSVNDYLKYRDIMQDGQERPVDERGKQRRNSHSGDDTTKCSTR